MGEGEVAEDHPCFAGSAASQTPVKQRRPYGSVRTGRRFDCVVGGYMWVQIWLSALAPPLPWLGQRLGGCWQRGRRGRVGQQALH